MFVHVLEVAERAYMDTALNVPFSIAALSLSVQVYSEAILAQNSVQSCIALTIFSTRTSTIDSVTFLSFQNLASQRMTTKSFCCECVLVVRWKFFTHLSSASDLTTIRTGQSYSMALDSEWCVWKIGIMVCGRGGDCFVILAQSSTRKKEKRKKRMPQVWGKCTDNRF